MESAVLDRKDVDKFYKTATALIVFTIVYNLLEGVVSIYFGFEDESLTLFGFGVDSFIEVMSGIGIAHMIYRIQSQPGENRDSFERTALRITGAAFYILVAGLTATSFYNIRTNHQPTTTFWGIVISIVSILVMWALIQGKTKSWKATKFPSYYCRRSVYESLYIYVDNFTCIQRDL